MIRGRKQGFCIEDSRRYLDTPRASCEDKYDCGNQGIQVGWVDNYGSSLDCQWYGDSILIHQRLIQFRIDITDVEPGDYILRVEVNPERTILESNFENNYQEIPFTIPRTFSFFHFTSLIS